MASLTRKEGYLLIDHRASPGVPESVALQVGLDPMGLRGGRMLENATLHCEHCGGVFLKNPERVRERHYCRHCDGYICDSCDGKRHQPGYVHASFEALVDAWTEASLKGVPLENSLDSLDKPKIIVP